MKTQTLDIQRLTDYLTLHIPDLKAPLSAEKFKGGQSNPTFKLSTADNTHYVLRRKPPGELLKSAHAVDREFRVITALRDTDVPVPNTFVLCEDDAIVGGDRRPVHHFLVDAVQALHPGGATARQVTPTFGSHRLDKFVWVATNA